MQLESLKNLSKTKIDSAGNVLRNNAESEKNINQALEILSSWRAIHSYPMHVFKKRLTRVAKKMDANALSAQRLKRVPSIIKKLNRSYDNNKETMRLTQMQDIAGCRAVMSTVKLAQELYQNQYLKSNLKHENINVKNYILNPKEDGYRSIHIVYKYKSDKGKDEYNGLLVEIQIRSKLQHVWATAVETVGFFTGHAIKTNTGEKEWESFFRLVSAAFAEKEGSPTIPDTSTDKVTLHKEIRKKEQELNAIAKMKSWADSMKYFETMKNKKNIHFFLLELDTIQEKLIITPYSRRQEKKAIADYAHVEKKIYGKTEYDVVLVGAETLSDLKKVYPNYFLDTREFVNQLNEIINN